MYPLLSILNCGLFSFFEVHSMKKIGFVIFSFLLTGCGHQAISENRIDKLNGDIVPPVNFGKSETIPVSVAQFVALRGELARQEVNVKEISTLDIKDPYGMLAVRLIISGPEKIDILNFPEVGDGYNYSIVGAKIRQDPVYMYGDAQSLMNRLRKTVNSFGRENLEDIITLNNYDPIVRDKSGNLYELGSIIPLKKEASQKYLKEYRDYSQTMETAIKEGKLKRLEQAWKGLLAKPNTNVGNMSLKEMSQQPEFAQLLKADNTLDVKKTVHILKKVDAQQNQASKIQGLASIASSDGVYTHNKSIRPLAGSGYYQETYMWGVREKDTKSTWSFNVMNLVPIPNKYTRTTIVGCSTVTGMAMVYDMWRRGEKLGNQAYDDEVLPVAYLDYQLLQPRARPPRKPNPIYEKLSERNKEGEFLATTFMNGRYQELGGTPGVGNAFWDFEEGLPKMLNHVFPSRNWEKRIAYEWKTVGRGSSGTMREIVARQLPKANAVAAMYSVGGKSGHTSIVWQAENITHLGGLAEDAYVKTIDHPKDFRLVTGYNTNAGIFSIYY